MGISDLEPDEIIRMLGMQPHPEGGWFVETYRDPSSIVDAENPEGRSASTAIYFLLTAGQVSHWHRVDAVEIWHWHAGSALALSIASTAHDAPATIELGNDLAAGQRPQGVVPRHAWQSAVSLGAWTLVGCTVAPGFDYAGFELAPDGWSPGPG
jgi:predicted cupin superfamily sugar epimerase